MRERWSSKAQPQPSKLVILSPTFLTDQTGNRFDDDRLVPHDHGKLPHHGS
jgi:hypothetical protein